MCMKKAQPLIKKRLSPSHNHYAFFVVPLNPAFFKADLYAANLTKLFGNFTAVTPEAENACSQMAVTPREWLFHSYR